MRPDGEAPLAGDERAAVAAVLAAAWSEPVTVAGAATVAERHHVVRVTTGDGRTAVVKRPRRPGDSLWGGEPDGLAVEWAVLDHLTGIVPPVAPRLYGGDDALGLVVMEDLPRGRTLATSLLGDDPAVARADLLATARTLARMHAATLGTAAAFGEARRRRGLAPTVPAWWPGRLVAAAPGMAAEAGALGVPAAGVAAELAEIGEVLATAYVGLVHGDPCPDNVVVADGDSRLLDFERTSIASIALDAGYLLAPFPSCWCFGRLPADLTAAAVAAYREVLAAAGVALGDGWDRALAAALGLWAATRVQEFRERGAGQVWGTTTGWPRLAAWTGAFLAAPGAAAFPHLAAALTRWREREGIDAATPVPDYPALAARDGP